MKREIFVPGFIATMILLLRRTRVRSVILLGITEDSLDLIELSITEKRKRGNGRGKNYFNLFSKFCSKSDFSFSACSILSSKAFFSSFSLIYAAFNLLISARDSNHFSIELITGL
ncbi:MAG: hypothetical protein WDO19_02790 [Bacteroidota bacterium]